MAQPKITELNYPKNEQWPDSEDTKQINETYERNAKVAVHNPDLLSNKKKEVKQPESK